MRRAAAGVVLGLSVAVGAPVAWQVTEEPVAAGASVERALSAPVPPSVPSGEGPAVAPASTLPPVTVRDAAPAATAPAPVPVRLAVPALGIEAPVDPVGVRGDGQMALPDDVDRVGWYRFGPAPGTAGSTVLAGHVDDRDQGLGVLAPLRDAAVGDRIEVIDAAGAATGWRVVSRDVIEKRALPLDQLFGRAGPPRLVLLTCGGPFLPDLGAYRDNVVVVAEPLP
ncbi:class F sortase [Geodermatophilus sabuli]|uniref:Class F sortase n=1 Tax=Geodermatophilus sabuli TaxID=1564158 RepID=A0A7K3W1X9_9ACTN|nr:class F sortase [Geodermatophilus sabuli]NEK58899.1 class F sortase [Geodermatophilus sabuli]